MAITPRRRARVLTLRAPMSSVELGDAMKVLVLGAGFGGLELTARLSEALVPPSTRCLIAL